MLAEALVEMARNQGFSLLELLLACSLGLLLTSVMAQALLSDQRIGARLAQQLRQRQLLLRAHQLIAVDIERGMALAPKVAVSTLQPGRPVAMAADSQRRWRAHHLQPGRSPQSDLASMSGADFSCGLCLWLLWHPWPASSCRRQGSKSLWCWMANAADQPWLPAAACRKVMLHAWQWLCVGSPSAASGNGNCRLPQQ